MQAFQSSEQRYTTLCNVIQCYSTLYQKYCAFSLVISPIFSTFVPLLITTKNQSNESKSNIICRSNGARTTLLPVHSTPERLAETAGAAQRESGLSLPHNDPPPIFPAERSQYYLPTSGPPVSGPNFALKTSLKHLSDFTKTKPRRYSDYLSALIRLILSFTLSNIIHLSRNT